MCSERNVQRRIGGGPNRGGNTITLSALSLKSWVYGATTAPTDLFTLVQIVLDVALEKFRIVTQANGRGAKVLWRHDAHGKDVTPVEMSNNVHTYFDLVVLCSVETHKLIPGH